MPESLIAVPSPTTRFLDSTTARRVTAFADSVGITPGYFLNKIANEWLDEKGDYVAARIHAAREHDAEYQALVSGTESNVIPITEGIRPQA